MEPTNVTIIGLLFTLLNGLLLVILPRQKAVIPLFLGTFFITYGQRINVAGLNFFMLRVMLIFGFLRMIVRGETSRLRLNNIDHTIIYWLIYSLLSYTLLVKSTDALVNRLGYVYNIVGLYFLFRCLIVDYTDIDRIIKYLSLFIVFLGALMLVEYLTGRNIFSVFGGVHEITQIRDGRLRCQGPFRHPILAGTVGAVSIPFSVALILGDRGAKSLGIAALMAGIGIVGFAGSSGPVMTLVFVVLGLLAWHIKAHMKAVRWAIVAGITLLHAVMKAPVWFLIGRLSDISGGGTGYHRAKVIDQAIKHLDEWWLLGTTHTTHWFPYHLNDVAESADITNQYIFEGVEGGLLKMILFVIIIVLCFQTIGKTVRASGNCSFDFKFLIWAMGVALFAHVCTFMSVTYFDQTIVLWYLLWAMISRVKDLSGPSQLATLCSPGSYENRESFGRSSSPLGSRFGT